MRWCARSASPRSTTPVGSRWMRFVASTFRSTAARSSRSWGRPAAARRRCSTASPASTRSRGGDVLIEGTSLKTMSDRQRTRYRARRMGFVFQFYNLLAVLTAVENVEMPLLLTGVPTEEARRARPGDARPRRPAQACRPAPGRALRRRTPARHHRPRPGQQPGHRLGGRAHRRPRQHQRAGDHRPHVQAQPGAQRDLRPGHARHQRRPPRPSHRAHDGRSDRRRGHPGVCRRSTPDARTSHSIRDRHAAHQPPRRHRGVQGARAAPAARDTPAARA